MKKSRPAPKSFINALKKDREKRRRAALTEMVRLDEEMGLYDDGPKTPSSQDTDR